MVQVYIACVSHVADPMVCPDIMKGLSEERCSKITSQKQLSRRRQSLGAGLLLRKVLETYGLSEQDVRIGTHGKPEVNGLYFNLSHSGDYVVCAVSDQSPVGCDLELIKEVDSRVAERFFSLKEREYLALVPQENYDEEFLRLWTMKESYVKMTGEGMTFSMKDYEFSIEDRVQVMRRGAVEPCVFNEYDIPGYKLTVCSEDAQYSDVIWVDI